MKALTLKKPTVPKIGQINKPHIENLSQTNSILNSHSSINQPVMFVMKYAAYWQANGLTEDMYFLLMFD